MKTREVVFLGGIHGVGKSTLADQCKELRVEHLRASDLIRKASSDARFDAAKRVKDVEGNQGILVRAFEQATADGGRFLLDGHFTLFNAVGSIERVPLQTFEALAPQAVGVVIDDAEEISSRLSKRDGRCPDTKVLAQMLDEELSHATIVSKSLDIQLAVIHSGDSVAFAEWIKKSFH
jgi:adenylate kinase